ncbi:hypothetical protein JKF63_07146 [Porcisia hertigi]|uniref:Uncharacterized protein n=1 Tax=Porcisia hertigi TaxID=2761500 RepID=A0A836LKN1_9TRYP|nr:hypothetical protein JKF63_07146 [Porcisia hertigi]
MLEPHHRQQRLQQGHWPLARSALLPAPQPQSPCERGEKVDLLSHASRQSDSLSIGCNAVVAPRGGASLAGSSLLTSRAASEAPSHLTAPKPMLGGRRTEPGITAGCPPTKRPSSWLMSSGVGGLTRELPSGGGNTNAAIEAPAAAAAASQYRYTWQTSKENTQATTEYAASVLQAETLLRGFERYRRSVSASPLTHTLSRPTLQPDSREAGGGGDREVQLSFAVEALGPHCAPSDITPHRGCEGLGSARNATAAQLPPASPSPLLAPQLDPEAFELAKRRALQVLCCNAHARAAYVVQGLRLSRAVYDDVLGRPVEATKRVVALQSAPSRRTTTVTPLSDGPPAPPRVTADAAPRVSHFSASPLLGRDSERKENQSPVASMPLMSEAERVAATAEAERALSLLSTIRAMRRQTEELTVSLLHACGEWGCWSTPPVNVDHAPGMPQGLSCASQVQPRDAKPEQHLFADLFLEGPVVSTGLSLSPSATLLGLREESPTAYLAALRAAGAVGDAVVALDTPRYSPVNTFAEESASRRGRACRVLRQALERQRQQGSLSTATAGAAFLDMALTPPQSALPPPPPTSVQLDIYAAHQRALRGAVSQRGGGEGEEAAQTVLARSSKTSGTAPSGGVATPYASLQKKLEALSTQRRQLQRTYDVLYAAAVEGQATSTDLHPDSHRKVQVGKAIPPTFPANADAETVVSAAPHTAEAPAGAPQEFETPLPSLFRPLAAVPDALHSAPCSSPPRHSSTDPSRGYQALALSDEIQSTSPIERAVDHTRPWEEPSTILEEEEGAAPPPRRRGADFSHSATTTTPVDGDTPEAEACPSGQPTSQSPRGGEGSRPGKDKPVLMEHREVQVRAGSVDGLDAATDISQIRSHQVTNMLRPPLSSASSSGTVDARGGVVGGRPEACEASWQPYTNAALSTHPDAAHAVVVVEEQRRAARHRERCKGRGSHSADTTAVVKMDDAVRHHLTRWISKQQRHTGYEGAVVSSSSPFLTQEELSVAAAWLRATSSPSIARKATNAPPPPPPAAVARVLNHVFPYSVGPASYNVAKKSPIASAPSKTSDSNGGEERQASRYGQQQPPLVSTSSTTPSRHSSSGASPQLQAASFGVQSLPRADSADTPVYDWPTSSPEWSGEVSDGDFKAPAAPLVLPAPALAHPRVVPKSKPPPPPPPPPPPRSRGTDGGASAVLQKPLKRKRRRGIFSRLFSCIG